MELDELPSTVMPRPAVTLTIWYQKLTSTCMSPFTSVTKIGRNSPLCLLWPWPLTRKSKQNSYEPKYISDKNWVKFPSLVFEIWCSPDFRDAQTHSRTDRPEYSGPPALFLNGDRSIKIRLKLDTQQWKKELMKCKNG